MRTKTKKAPIIIAAVVAGIAVLTLILGFIPLRNAPNLANDDLRGVQVYTGGSAQMYLSAQDQAEQLDTIIKAYNDTRKFSVLRGILVGKLGGMKLTPDEEEGDRYDQSELEALKGDSAQHMLIFVYDNVQEVKIKGEVFKYNYAKVLVTDTDNEIGEFTVALYNSNEFYEPIHGPGDELYSVRLIKAKGKCTKLFDAINDLLA